MEIIIQTRDGHSFCIEANPICESVDGYVYFIAQNRLIKISGYIDEDPKANFKKRFRQHGDVSIVDEYVSEVK